DDLANLSLLLMNLDPSRRPDAEFVRRCITEGTLPNASVEAPNLAHLTSDLIGRSDELSKLERALERTVAGAPNLLLIHGPSGIGKSALLDHFCNRAASSGATVLRSRCRERE